MPKTWSQIIDDIEARLQDGGIDPGGNASQVFSQVEIESHIFGGLVAVSFAKPWEYKLTKTTTTSSRDITLTSGDKWRLLSIDKLEYLVDQDPRQFRNFTKFGDVISMETNTAPGSAGRV